MLVALGEGGGEKREVIEEKKRVDFFLPQPATRGDLCEGKKVKKKLEQVVAQLEIWLLIRRHR